MPPSPPGPCFALMQHVEHQEGWTALGGVTRSTGTKVTGQPRPPEVLKALSRHVLLSVCP